MARICLMVVLATLSSARVFGKSVAISFVFWKKYTMLQKA